MAIKYKWLTASLKELILKNTEKGINRLPTEQELCQKYKVSRQTVRTSLGILETEGLITRRQGSGCYITGRSDNPGKNIICVLLASDRDYLYPALLGDIHSTLLANGYSDQVFVTGGRIFRERQILLSLLENPPRGILAEGCKSALPNPNTDLYLKLADKGCVVVFLHSAYAALPNCLCVKSDNRTGSALLVRHLAGLGHTSIAGIFRYDDRQGMERFQGFSEAVKEEHLTLTDEHLFWFGTHELETLSSSPDSSFIRQLLHRLPSSCTAVICQDDGIAYELVKELARDGRLVPDDIAVASFDNSYLSESASPAITSLSHDSLKPGCIASQLLADRLKGLPASSREVPWKLHIRESTAGKCE